MSEPDPAQHSRHESPRNDLLFLSLDDFVSEYLAQVVRRRLSRAVAVWCPEWWQHPEAVARLSVLWRAFEFHRRDPMVGLSTWWLHHADPHLHALMHPVHGPFVMCDAREGHSASPPGPLPTKRPPDVLLRHAAFALQPEDLEAIDRHYSASDQPNRRGDALSEPGEPDDGGGKRKTKDKEPGQEQGI